MQTITIVILRAPAALTLAQEQALKSGLPLYLQTEKHPSAKVLLEHRISFTSMAGIL